MHRERNQGKVILHAITFHDRCSLTLTSSLPPKNIHIWSFKPSRIEQGEEKESTWTCLYDTQTNGGSISQLYFRHNAHGLQAISKSDDQKLRVWDLSWEEKRVAQGLDEKDRPKRPGYVDVASTENTVGVGGNYAFSLSSASEAIINLIPLDADDLSSPFNVTELALPMIDGAVDHHAMSSRPSRSGRQQRGELKSVVNVCGLVFDTSHALLNVSDGSIVHYSHDESGHPVLAPCSQSLSKTSVDSDSVLFGTPLIPNQNKKMCLARVGAEGTVVLAVSSYDDEASRGALMFRALPVGAADSSANKNRRFWGFNGLKKRRRQSPVYSVALKKPLPERKAALPSPSTDIISLQRTPEAEVKLDERKKPVMMTPGTSVSKVDKTMLPASSRDVFQRTPTLLVDAKNKRSNHFMPTPGASAEVAARSGKNETMRADKPIRKESTSIVLPQPTLEEDTSTPTTFVHNKSSIKTPVNRVSAPEEPERMDSQLESLVNQCSNEALKTPAKSDKETGTSSDQSEGEQEPTSPEDSSEPIAKKRKTYDKTSSKRGSSNSMERSAAPSTPRKSARKKQWSSPRKAAPSNSDLPPIESSVPGAREENQVCHLGITRFERKEDPELPHSCFQPKQQATLLAEQFCLYFSSVLVLTCTYVSFCTYISTLFS